MSRLHLQVDLLTRHPEQRWTQLACRVTLSPYRCLVRTYTVKVEEEDFGYAYVSEANVSIPQL